MCNKIRAKIKVSVVFHDFHIKLYIMYYYKTKVDKNIVSSHTLSYPNKLPVGTRQLSVKNN